MSVLQDSAPFQNHGLAQRVWAHGSFRREVPAMTNGIGRAIAVAILALMALSIALDARARAGFTITPTFDSSITDDPNAATIEGTINGMIQQYESLITSSVNVTVTFKEMSSGLGESNWYYTTTTYSNFRSRLASDATSSNDSLALAHLPNSVGNPVNGNASVNLQLANARALGISAFPPAGQTDGTISLNTSIMNLSRSSINPGKYDLLSTASHEMDEVLGIASALTGLSNGAAAPAGPVWPLDLFRYDQNGARSFDTGATTQAYFSLDGTTDLVRFNQHAGGDFNDWYSYPSGGIPPRVQDAYATPGATPNLGVELAVLDAIGYTLGPIPGDVTHDGIVNGLDIQLVASNWLATGTNAADANGDGTVNGLDINLMASHWLVGAGVGTGAGAGLGGGASVPEPTSLALAVIATLGLLLHVKRARCVTAS